MNQTCLQMTKLVLHFMFCCFLFYVDFAVANEQHIKWAEMATSNLRALVERNANSTIEFSCKYDFFSLKH